MTQQERQARSRQAILHAALEEFGEHGYDGVNMERICGNHGISKGMMYHYYSSKDELFLACVSEVFQNLHRFLRAHMNETLGAPASEAVKRYFLLREDFFQCRPREKRLFETAILYPPAHLAGQIQELRTPIREENDIFIRRLLSRMTLRSDLDMEQAARYLNSIYAAFWPLLEQYQANHARELHSMLKGSGELLDMVLFGIAEPSGAGKEEEEVSERRKTL